MKKEIYLNYIEPLKQALKGANPRVQVLLGPRQVGKTTTILKLIREDFPTNSHYVSADKVFQSDAGWLRQEWILAQQSKKILFVDEIQKVGNWAETIKQLYDESLRLKKPVPCVLLGSSSLEIQKGITESLTGRFQLRRAHHWNYAESHEAYGLSIEDYLKRGGYPGAYELSGDEWFDYVSNSVLNTVVEKDILQFASVRNPALFRQAFQLLMNYPAQELSYTKLLGQLQEKGNVELVKHYIHLFEGAYLLRALEKYSGSALRKRSSSPKIVPLAPCLYYLQLREDYSPSEEGHVLELLVGAQLVRTGAELYYWREGPYEVDYVLKSGRKLWAIEVKSGRKKNSKGLSMFKDKYPKAQQVLIHWENYEAFEKDPMGFLDE